MADSARERFPYLFKPTPIDRRLSPPDFKWKRVEFYPKDKLMVVHTFHLAEDMSVQHLPMREGINMDITAI